MMEKCQLMVWLIRIESWEKKIKMHKIIRYITLKDKIIFKNISKLRAMKNMCMKR